MRAGFGGLRVQAGQDMAAPRRGRQAMATDQDVERFVTRLGPAPVCDACIAERLGGDLAAVGRSTAELAGSAGFVRDRAPCSLCEAGKLVIRRR
jgi:hypothetical protein